MSRGPRSTPPDLPGFTADRWIGGGGFADVFVYTQLRPSRQVAIKILRREHLSATALAQFDAEADIMAEVSTHPYIVTIFTSGVSPDGRPYIVMEHYPEPNFGERAKGGALDVSEVLRTGIQVAAAVETAHRAGIIHRDIKPANILTSAFGRPGLTDFGISGVQVGGTITEATGITVAYTAPELLSEESAGSIATDIYGLGATVSALLAGHSPFWSPGGDNTAQAVLARSLSGHISASTRPDVPATLRNVLTQAMALDPRHRHASALLFAQALQHVEQELRLSPTPIEVAPTAHDRRRAEAAVTGRDDAEERTRRSIQVVDPEGPSVPTHTRRARVAPASKHGAEPVFGIVAHSSTPPVTPLPDPGAPSIPTPVSAAHTRTPPTRHEAEPVSRAPHVTTGVPELRTSPSWEREPPGVADEADTVARPRTAKGFTPPPVAPGTPAQPAPPVDGGRSPYRTSPPVPEEMRAPTPAPRPRRLIPWKLLGVAAALVVVVSSVVFLASRGDRDSKAGPGSDRAASGPIQSIPAGPDRAGEPVVTPTDLQLSHPETAAGGTGSATLTWTPPAATDALLELSIAPTPPSRAAIAHEVTEASTGQLEVTMTRRDGVCSGVAVGETKLSAAYCADGPPCFQAVASVDNAAIGDPVIARMDGDGHDAGSGVPPTDPSTYNQTCLHAFTGTS